MVLPHSASALQFDEEFAAYGLTEDEISDLRAWAQRWIDDLDQRLSTAEDDNDA
ncbi:hypothetical protein ACWGCW_12775 [Streptomyces sp. NPDC054933]